MPHTGIHAISARQNKMNKRWVSLVVLAGVRVLLQISAPFTPLSTFRFQPLPAVATHGIDVDITFHYVISQFSALADSALLGVSWRCSQVSQVSQVSQCWQPPHAVIHSYQQAQVAKS